jgi:hypothetical protein
MRIPTYLSYSSLTCFEKTIEEFFVKYLAETRAPRMPQERPASVGSAFDARVKASLHEALYGKNADPKYTFEALFEAQVEAHNRDWALDAGLYVFECYKLAGQYDTLLELLKKSIEPPRMEFDVKGDILGVPFLAKPDLRYVLPGPVKIVHDFKVNGFCGKSGTSPNKGYMVCNDGFKAAKQNKGNGCAHAQFKPFELVPGYVIDTGYLEDCSTTWADQLTLYGWALGEKPGDELTVLSVDQIVAKPVQEGRPLLRVASFRARVRKSYQEFLAKRLVKCWEIIKSEHIFRDMTAEQSKQRQEILQNQAVSLCTDGSPEEEFYAQVVRPVYRG